MTRTIAAILKHDAIEQYANDRARIEAMSAAWDRMADHTLRGGPEYDAAKVEFHQLKDMGQ